MTEPLLAAMAVGIGGAAGALARHAVGLAIESRWSLVVVNTLGSFALGVVIGVPTGPSATLAVGVGFCGAFTTFSSFAVETVTTAEAGDPGTATAFAALNVVAAVAALLTGSGLALVVT
ncbi:CrcB protein [Halorubrum alkaliphilum]|uniref:Fluoride-specific ion channel FluC n=1 Tax=Halorubrum alkaliphilum TaxID=261290 RepID=A0A8T4GGW4_9EURY|nr:CrcB family protein [Halorubrum alkaliphilum]MBP1922969.1 CrcB protein [Halorubrum alkaliphilum]